MLPSFKEANEYSGEYFNIQWGGRRPHEHKRGKGKIPKRYRKVLERHQRSYREAEKWYIKVKSHWMNDGKTQPLDMYRLRFEEEG